MTRPPTSAASSFVHQTLPGRVVFGVGSVATLPDEVDRLGARRTLLVAGERVAGELAGLLGNRVTGTVTEVVQHVPVATAERARTAAEGAGADCVVACGGGSAIGVAKAIALVRRVTIVAVPTTYSGSEMTPIWGLTDGGRKTTGRDPQVLPATVVYDPALTVGLPPALTASSGMNALAHCVEACWSPGATPLAAAQAEEGARLLASGLRRAVAAPADLDGRAGALLGAWLAGTALAAAGTALHHQLCHVLGGAYGLDHAGVHSALLPHTTAFVAPAAPEAMARIGRALGTGDPAGAIHDLATELGAPTSLAALGFGEGELDAAAALAAPKLARHPRPAGTGEVRALLADALAGSRPKAAATAATATAGPTTADAAADGGTSAVGAAAPTMRSGGTGSGER